jgi:hypothetical protein
MAFGDKNPITPCLNSFVATISERPAMGSWGEQDWKALNWLVASGVRKVFIESHDGVGRGALSHLVLMSNDLAHGRRFTSAG